MSIKWIKVPVSILDMSIVGMLSDHLWRCTIEMAMMSSLKDNKGELPEMEIMCWYLRRNPDDLIRDLRELNQEGIVYQKPDGTWFFKLFNRFYSGSTSAERVKRYRERRVQNGMTASPGYDEDAIKRRDEYKCVYCGSPSNLCVDHVYPILLGGTDDYRNLACACKTCNGNKAGRTPKQAEYIFLNKVAEDRYLDYLEEMELV